MIRQQWKAIFTNKKQLVPLLAILFIPIMYAGMFLWAFWDPYAQLEDLPVAVVNEDAGATYQEEQLELGTDLLTNLEERQDFKFESFTREQADAALENKEVYMVIEIPEDFSHNATTLLGESPSQMELIYRPNEAFNFLSSQIGETAIARIQSSVNEQVTQTFTEGIYEAVDSLKDGIGNAADGSAKLEDGALSLKQGTSELKSYLNDLAAGSVTLTDGTAKLAQGVQQAQQGSATLTTKLGDAKEGAHTAAEGAAQLSAGTTSLQQGIADYTAAVDKLSDGSETLKQGQSQFNAGISQAVTSTAQLQQGLSELAAGSEELATSWNGAIAQIAAGLPPEQAAALKAQLEPLLQATQTYSSKMQQAAGGGMELANGLEQLQTASQDLEQGTSQVADGLEQLASKNSALTDGANQVNSGTTQLAGKLPELESGLEQLQQGSARLTAGLTEAAEGAGQLTSGSTTLASSSQQLADGAGKLADGSTQLAEGTTELHNGLADGSLKASEFKAGEASAKAVAQPVQVEKAALHEVPNYGTGFSPYFISLGLFVGALLTSIVFPLRDPASSPTSGVRWYSSKTLVVGVIGILQALIVAGLAIWVVGVDPVNPSLFVAGTVLTSLTFMALVQFFVTTLGDAGRFVAIILLILQLTTSAGTFPLELLPKALQVFNHWLPMTYSVDLFKSAISIEGGAGFTFSATVLAGFAIAFSVATLLYFVFSFRKFTTKEA